MVVTMLEMRSLPFLCSERAKQGVNMNCVWLFAEMIDKANVLPMQGILGVSESLEPKWGRVLTEQGIPEMMWCLPVVVEESLRAVKQVLRCTAGKRKGSGGAFKSPEEVLDHVL